MSTPGRTAAASRLVVISYNGRNRRFDLDGKGCLSFAHVARVFRIPVTALDDCDAWTLDDTSLRIDKSDAAALLTVSALRDLFPLPAGTADQPLVLRTDDSDCCSGPPEAAPGRQSRRQSKGAAGTPGRGTGPAAKSPATATASAAAAATAALGAPSARTPLASPTTRSAAAAAATAAAAAGGASPLRPRAAVATPRAQRTAAGAAPPSPSGGFQTPGAASPLRGARTPLGLGAGAAPLPPRMSPQPGAPSTRALRRLLPSLQLELSAHLSAELLRHPKGQGRFFFSPAAAQHLPMLMACHLPPPLQRLLRCFSEAAQCVITARAMALYAATEEAEYFRDQKLEAALTEARSRNPPQDRFCAYSQSVRLTGRKRKPAASPHRGGGGGTTPQPTRGSAAIAAGAATAPASTDVDMDAGGWSFAGGGTLHCPGGVACKKAGRHENWLLSGGAGGDPASQQITYLPVLYDSEEHSAVLLPLADAVRSDPSTQGGAGAAAGTAGAASGSGARAAAAAAAAAPQQVWFRYEYESRGGRRGHNFWDLGLAEYLEQAVRDVAGEEALRLAGGA